MFLVIACFFTKINITIRQTAPHHITHPLPSTTVGIRLSMKAHPILLQFLFIFHSFCLPGIFNFDFQKFEEGLFNKTQSLFPDVRIQMFVNILLAFFKHWEKGVQLSAK
jgi:hypothetical protein